MFTKLEATKEKKAVAEVKKDTAAEENISTSTATVNKEEFKTKIDKLKHQKVLTKISVEQKRKYLEKAGETTILREIARNLKRIKKNMDLVIGILTIFFAVITGVLLGYKEYIITLIPAMITIVLAIISYTLPAGDLKDAVDNFQETIIRK